MSIQTKFKHLTLEEASSGDYFICTHDNGTVIRFAYDGTLAELFADHYFKSRMKHFDTNGSMEDY